VTTADRALPSWLGWRPARRHRGRYSAPPKSKSIGLNFYYGHTQALRDISVKLTPNVVTAFIGPVRLRQEHVSSARSTG
jgi:hypothetical protein